MAGKSAALTVNVVADASKAVKAFTSTGDAGKAMAQQLNMAADRMERDLENTKKIADKLAQSLGPKFKSTVGENIDDIAAQFNRAGLKIEDVEKNLPDLVRGLKRVEDQADHTADEMTRIGHETDKTGSVMANFAGNAAQELPLVSDAFGPLNMAISQFVEYGAEGDIKLSNLLKTGLAMGGIAIVMQGLSAILNSQADAEKKAAEAAASRLRVYNDLSDRKYADAAQELYDNNKDAYDMAKRMGVSTELYTKILTGSSVAARAAGQSIQQQHAAQVKLWTTIRDQSTPGTKEYTEAISKLTALQLSGDTTMKQYINQLLITAGAYDSTASSAETAASKTATIETVLRGYTTTTQGVAAATRDAAAAVWELFDAQLGLINLQLGQRGAERNYRKALEDYNKINSKGNATEDEKAQALDDVEYAALALAQANGDLASSTGTVAQGAQAQIDTFTALAAALAPGSELRNNLEGYKNQLERVARMELIRAELARMSSSGSFANYDRLLSELNTLQSMPAYANGTMNAQAGLALVGENGPELIDFGGGERVYNNRATSSMLGDGGGASIVVNMPAGSDGDDVVRALQKWVRRNGQIPLPITADQRR